MSAVPTHNWILIRGLVREAAHWGEFRAQYQAAFPDAKLYFLDLPGNGVHHALRTPASVPAMADFIHAAFRDLLGVDPGAAARPSFVFSVSLAGMVTVAWAKRYPEDLAGAVLGNTSLGAFSAPHERFNTRNLPTILRAATMRDMEERERRILGLLSNGKPEVLAQVAKEWVAIQRQRPVRRANAARQILAAARYRGPRQAPRVPLLILAGDRDRLVPPSCSAAIARAWQAPLRVHPTAGHNLSLDAGSWVCDNVRQWHQSLLSTATSDAGRYAHSL